MEVSGLQEPVKLMDETVFSSWMFMVYTGACVVCSSCTCLGYRSLCNGRDCLQGPVQPVYSLQEPMDVSGLQEPAQLLFYSRS
jgi:hypothetical protein